MLNKISKYLLPIIILIMTFFINAKDVSAVEKCTWYSYETGIYYDQKNNNYKPVRTYDGKSLVYTLKFDTSYFRGNFKLVRANKHFSDSIIQKELEKSSVCPNYVGVQYNRKSKNDREVIHSESKQYKEYIKNQYDGEGAAEDYNTISISGIMDQDMHIESNDKTNGEPHPMIFTSIKTSYRQSLKLDYLDDEVETQFYDALTKGKIIGFEDKGKKEHTKEEFYNVSAPIWSKAIDNMYSRLKTSCSAYSNPNSRHGDKQYLDLIDADVFPDLMATNNVQKYDSKKYPTIPNETCFNTIYEAKFMQASFIDWFKLVDWLCLTKADNASNFNQFFKYYEFAHLQSNGGEYVASIRNLLTIRKSGNESLDDYNAWASSSKRCEALCKDLKNDDTNNYSYDQCITGSQVNACKSYENQCQEKCLGVSGDNGACVEVCLKEKLDKTYGDGTYTTMEQNYNEIQNENKEEIKQALEEMKDEISKIESPKLNGIKFEPYKAKCEDVEFLHSIYVAMRIIAPILVILLGTFDFTKSVMAADEQKILEARKKFPKRLILLILFILVPIIINVIVGTFDGETSLMKCIISGS